MKALDFLTAALLSGAAVAKTPLTIEHLNKLNKVYDVVVSPDGRYLVYGQKKWRPCSCGYSVPICI